MRWPALRSGVRGLLGVAEPFLTQEGEPWLIIEKRLSGSMLPSFATRWLWPMPAGCSPLRLRE